MRNRSQNLTYHRKYDANDKSADGKCDRQKRKLHQGRPAADRPAGGIEIACQELGQRTTAIRARAMPGSGSDHQVWDAEKDRSQERYDDKSFNRLLAAVKEQPKRADQADATCNAHSNNRLRQGGRRCRHIPKREWF